MPVSQIHRRKDLVPAGEELISLRRRWTTGTIRAAPGRSKCKGGPQMPLEDRKDFTEMAGSEQDWKEKQNGQCRDQRERGSRVCGITITLASLGVRQELVRGLG